MVKILKILKSKKYNAHQQIERTKNGKNLYNSKLRKLKKSATFDIIDCWRWGGQTVNQNKFLQKWYWVFRYCHKFLRSPTNFKFFYLFPFILSFFLFITRKAEVYYSVCKFTHEWEHFLTVSTTCLLLNELEKSRAE